MTKKTSNKVKSILSLLLAVCLLAGLTPAAFAAQSNEYVDPADNWLTANGRTDEFDINATTTYETQYCHVCNKDTTLLTYRVPEYTRSGETALNRGVLYSDGMNREGTVQGNTDSGTPGVNASYTGYHYTKSVCQVCGTINTVDGPDAYNFNRNVYGLNPCDHNFFLDFDNTTYEPYNNSYHTTTLKRGEYCQFCKGTYARATEKRESHDFNETVDGQIGNNRFYVSEHCSDCDYKTSEYVTAKSVVASYYGTADGAAHTVTVSDLSDGGVHTKIRYGTKADNCNLTSAPNYTSEGYYPVYYEIDYSYSGENMTENGVSYVWLLADSANNNTGAEMPHAHDYRYIETVAPSCDNLGYERWQCDGCGRLEKRNYTQSTGHDYKAIIIREANCKQGGMKLNLCSKCGSFYEETTPTGGHDYTRKIFNPTCRNVGYTQYTCSVCNDNYMTDITPIISHSFERVTKEPTCTDKGYTTSTCTMCGLNYVSDYTEPTGHEWDEGHSVTSSTCTSEGVIEFNCLHCREKMIKAESATGHTPGAAATCTEPQICTVCNTVLELPKGHRYDGTIIPSSCTAMGYTIFECKDCGDSYTGEFTDKTEHDYNRKITAPTCTAMGFTEYECTACGDTFTADYTDKLPHSYNTETKLPTCTEFGFTTFTCKNCGESYIGNYTDKTEHNYSQQIIPPTCTDHGYTIYKCPDCGKEYIGDLTDCQQHTYIETVTPPTCTEMGFSTFICEACGDTYKAEYKEPTGHNPSAWVIDVPATIEHSGSKHVECSVCGETLQSADIPQLADKDNSDEDGKAQLGAYSIILTDKDGKPIFNSEITIDINDNISIKLPEGRLLDYSDQTTITAFFTDTQAAAEDLQIFIYDGSNNAATGKTDENGQLKVPNSQSSTGDDNGTIGGGDGEEKHTFVVTVTDKTNVVIPNCDISIGESNQIVVDLPDGVKPTRENPVIISVADQNGNAQKDITVIAIGDADFIEKGVTDIYGKVTLPSASDGYTDGDGRVNVDELNVMVNDELGAIPNAYVVHNEDGTITVKLPENKSISYDNRITVTVLDSIGEAVPGVGVTVKDIAETTYTVSTDADGKIIVPPVNEDITDSEGKAVVNGYNVLVEDETKPIENAFISITDEKISVKLPEGELIDIDNRITAIVTNKDGAAVKDMPVTFTDSAEKSEINLTDENGRATVPPTNIDYTDINGYAEVDGYVVIVSNETGFIEKAFITLNTVRGEPDESGNAAESKDVSVLLPENVLIDYANRVTVTVLNKADNTPARDMPVTVAEAKIKTETDYMSEPKTASGVTNAHGKLTVPPINEDYTDDNGSSGVTDTKPGEDTDGDGKPDTEESEISFTITVEDTKGKIANAFVIIKDGKIHVTLPDTHTLTTNNQTTVTVTDKDAKPVSGISVTIKDKTTEKTAATNASGKVTLPAKSSGGGGGGSSIGGGGGGGYVFNTAVNVKITDRDGKAVTGFSKSTDSKGVVTITLPAGKTLEDGNWYTITVTDRNGKGKTDTSVILKDKNKNEASGTTDKNGVLILPASEHKAYIVGYPDGTFKPDGDMTRAEAAAIFARLIAEKKGESINGKPSFKDTESKEWYYSYIGYLEKYNIIKGYADNTFRPDAPVTRAEFVAMAVRFYGLFDEVKATLRAVKYTDISGSHWAVNDIAFATDEKWLNGYADGSFRPDVNITRAEVVTVTNRAMGRNADKDYINGNLSALNKFTDLRNNVHWAFYDILEAANDHKAVSSTDSETWVK